MKYLNNKGLIVSFIYLIITIFFRQKYYILYTNIINPIFWGVVFIYLIKTVNIRLNIKKRQLIYFAIILFITISLYAILGYMGGFSKTPYSHKIIAIFKNIFIQIIPIIGIETYRMNVVSKSKNNKLIVVIITILLILLQIDYHNLNELLINKEELFRYICSTIVPIIICNIIYTYFIFKGMYLFSVSYRIFGNLFTILVPILPNIDWYIKGSIDILFPYFMYILFKYKFSEEKNDIRKRKEILLEKFNYIATFIFSFILISFMIGIFKYEPICILSNSMIPTYKKGDVVIYKKINENELKNIQKNTIIIYMKEDKNIAHRVVNTVKTNNSVLYQTKGDSNNVPDTDLVEINQIKGVYIFHIRYIGLPSVWLYNYFHK